MAKSGIEVEVKNIVGKTDDGREVESDMDQIMLEGRVVGFVQRKEGAHINLIAPVAEAELKAIQSAVTARHGELGKLTSSDLIENPVVDAPPIAAERASAEE